jgi:probable addiction module antidote protein
MNKKNIREIHDIELRDPCIAAEYINHALESEDQAVIMMAIRNVVNAQEGGMARVSERAHLGRESMYKMLSANGNPKLNSLTWLLHGLGLKLKVEAEKNVAGCA